VSLKEGSETDRRLPKDVYSVTKRDLEAEVKQIDDLRQRADQEAQSDGGPKWEYKTSEEDTNIYGPFSSTQMAEWQETVCPFTFPFNFLPFLCSFRRLSFLSF